MKYRADLDGIRAIAVMAVVGFHMFPKVFSGGFVGVDIFFVLSGFLITNILLTTENLTDSNLLKFYERRARRILPAFLLVILSVCIFGYYALLPDEYKLLGKHIAHATVFSLNYLLNNESGYFDVNAFEKPLLHLWSLSVEAQFYLFWPLIVIFAIRFKRNCFIFLSVSLMSFLYSCILTSYNTNLAYYSSLSRGWELSLGALLAAFLFSHEKSSVSSRRFEKIKYIANVHVLSLVAIFVLIIFIFWFKNRLGYPSGWALVPVFGTLLLIYVGPNAIFNKWVCSSPILIFLGRISYPLYLWHWPIFSYLHITGSMEPSYRQKLVGLIVSIFLAIATYFFIEIPIQKARSHKKSFFLIGILIFGVLTFYIGRQIAVLDGLPKRDAIVKMMKIYKPIDWSNDGRNSDKLCFEKFSVEEMRYCLISDLNREPTIALIGDSHANHFYWGFKNYFDSIGENLIMLGGAGCVPSFDMESHQKGEADKCRILINHAFEFILNSKNIKTVMIASRGPFYTTGLGFGEAEYGKYNWQLSYVPEKSIESNYEAYFVGLDNTLSRLTQEGKSLIYVYDVPELGFNPEQCVETRPFRFFSNLREPCAIAKQQFLDRNVDFRKGVMNVLKKYPNIKVFDPAEVLCDESQCFALKDGRLLYRDDNHLSYDGSLAVGRHFH